MALATKGTKQPTAAAPASLPVRYSHEKFLQELGARIRQLRKERGWTLRDMVVAHGFHVSQWQAFERGKRGIAVPSLLRICEIFGLNLCALLGTAGEVSPHDARAKKEED